MVSPSLTHSRTTSAWSALLKLTWVDLLRFAFGQKRERHQRDSIANMPVTVERRVRPEGIITRLRRYYIDESRFLMKWQYFCGFIVPAGLLFLFPELSLVRYDWPCTMHTHNEKDIGEN